ncbi:hypothetical protein AQ962_03655 [Burkholderia pseudomallei]|uniref:hypothetical protein n=1 Tax=Burkholderia pseudomallei TaxID=28450 RepID=UPI0009781840|nr:hypothetical protein [Burkholderia pseudomallei]OMW13624.1 hypothetical protein AQ804_29990 [Burkholderia pseudomallei]OMW19934.1 hypothetical protein AQ805_02920 [Burkholderia pseudomallei]ONF14171.1 hypothetical protein AQ962_03655 [Burkholderia pseudomallei]ONF14245.1 hypothetical protein AQ961_22010 [Burkholderia pseudomallei]ONF19216.1 hypothetical protein AQ963_29420 [Burkholderia pseudomallei]
MADRRQLEAELEKLDTRLADERQAVSVVRRQLDSRPLIPAPSVGAAWHPEAHAVAELRAVLAARRSTVSRLEAQRAAVAARLEQAKRLQPAPRGAISGASK